MELQQNDSAETDVEMEKLSRQTALFNTIKELKQNCNTLTFDESKHLIKVMDVFEITKRYLLNGYYSATKKRRIVETIMSFLPSQSGKKDPQETMPYPWSRKKDPQETRPENPGAASSRKITLGSSDGEAFEVDEAVALELRRMEYYIDCNCPDNGTPLPEVTSKILSKVIEYCKKHVESRNLDDCSCLILFLMSFWVALMLIDGMFLLVDLSIRNPETLPENPRVASHTSRKITLGSSDGEAFEVDKAVALESLRMKYYIDCNCTDNIIPLPEVTSKILSKVIEYCKKHVESRKSDDCATGAVDDDLKAWDAEFVKVDQATLFDLIRAAHYLDIKSLSKLTCKTFLDMSRGKTQEEFKRAFKLLFHTV